MPPITRHPSRTASAPPTGTQLSLTWDAISVRSNPRPFRRRSAHRHAARRRAASAAWPIFSCPALLNRSRRRRQPAALALAFLAQNQCTGATQPAESPRCFVLTSLALVAFAQHPLIKPVADAVARDR